MSASRGKGSNRSIRNLLSLALFGVAAALFVIVGVMYVRDRNDDKSPARTPVNIPGNAELINVSDALAAQDLEVEFLRGAKAGIRIKNVIPPGQGLTVDGHPVYVFIFESPEDREQEMTKMSPEALVSAGSGANGTPVAEGEPHGVGGSNIYAVLYGGDADVIAKVDAAIQGIP